MPRSGGEYTEGLVSAPRVINPMLGASNDADRDISALVFSSLMKFDASGALVPDLASAYNISEDHKIYTFTLRDQIRWHDNTPLTVDDIIYTIRSIQDPVYKSPLRVSFSGVDVRQIDDKTISFILKEPFPAFLSVLTVGIIPKHVWYPIPAASANLAEANIKPIGSGPYMFSRLTKDSMGVLRNIVLEKNPLYYGEKPYLDRITFKFYADASAAVDALKNKNVDGLSFLPFEYKSEISQNKSIRIKNLQLPHYTALFFNPLKQDMLKDKAVRRALAHGIDRERILKEAVGGSGSLIDAPLLPGFFDIEPNVTTYTYDVDAARKILEDAGFKVADDTPFRIKGDRELALTLTTGDQQENVQAASVIKENWDALGIKTELRIIPRSEIRKDVIEPREYELLLFGAIISANQDPYSFWHSSQTKHPGNNLSEFANKDIDATLEKLRTTYESKERFALYEKFQTKLTEELFAIFLYSPARLYPVQSRIQGLSDEQRISQPSDRFNAVASWYTRTTRRWRQ